MWEGGSGFSDGPVAPVASERVHLRRPRASGAENRVLVVCY